MIWLTVSAGIAAGDLLIRRLVRSRLSEGENRPLPGGKAVLTKSFNKGAAMGLLADRPQLLRNFSLASLGLMGISLIRARAGRRKLAAAGSAMVIGGGAGNLMERMKEGRVTDYIRFPSLPGRLGKLVFNISDFAIFAGMILTLIGGGKHGDDR